MPKYHKRREESIAKRTRTKLGSSIERHFPTQYPPEWYFSKNMLATWNLPENEIKTRNIGSQKLKKPKANKVSRKIVEMAKRYKNVNYNALHRNRKNTFRTALIRSKTRVSTQKTTSGKRTSVKQINSQRRFLRSEPKKGTKNKKKAKKEQEKKRSSIVTMAQTELVDLAEIAGALAEKFLKKDQKKSADLQTPLINWDYMIVKYGETVYTQPTGSPKPQAHVLFSANFTNNTPSPQTYALRTERRTRSECTVTFTKSFTFGAELSIKIGPPNPIIGVNTGFKSEITKETGVEETFEQYLSWSVDNQVKVPPGFETKAELVINENHYNGDFEEMVTFEGIVLVTFEDKKTHEHITTLTLQVNKLFNSAAQGFRPDNKGRPTFTVKGTCKSRFGIEQNVRLTEREIVRKEDEEEEEKEE